MLAFLIVVVSLLGHVLGGGDAPAAVPFALAVLVTTPVVWWAARRRLGPMRVVALLGAGQMVFHGVFQATAPAAAYGHVQRHVHDHLHAAGPSLPAGHGSHGWHMIAGHAVATVVLAAVLAWADDLATRLLAFLRLLVRAACALDLVARQGHVPAMPAPRPVEVLAPATGAGDRRGPPGS